MGGLLGGGCVTAASEPNSSPGSPSTSRRGAGSESTASRSESVLEKRSKFAHPYHYLEKKYSNRRKILNYILVSSLEIAPSDLDTWTQERGDWNDVAMIIVDYSAFTVPSILDFFWLKMKNTGGLTEQGIFRVSPNSRVISKATDILHDQSMDNIVELECGDFDLEKVMAQALSSSADGLEFQNSVSRSTIVTPIAIADGSASPSGTTDLATNNEDGSSTVMMYSLLDCHCWATLIKMWFRQCEMNLLGSIDNDHLGNGETLIKAQRDMNEIERVLFEWIIDVSVTVSRERDSNLMSPQNMAIIFSPCVMMPRTQDGSTTSAEDAMMDPMVMMNLMRRSQVMVKFIWACIDEISAKRATEVRSEMAGSLENSTVDQPEHVDDAGGGIDDAVTETETELTDYPVTQSDNVDANEDTTVEDGSTVRDEDVASDEQKEDGKSDQAEIETQETESVKTGPSITSAEEMDQCTEAVFGAAVHAIEDATAEFERAEKKRAAAAAAAAASDDSGNHSLGI